MNSTNNKHKIILEDYYFDSDDSIEIDKFENISPALQNFIFKINKLISQRLHFFFNRTKLLKTFLISSISSPKFRDDLTSRFYIKTDVEIGNNEVCR